MRDSWISKDRWIWAYFARVKWRMGILGLLVFSGSAVGLINPQIVSRFIDDAGHGWPILRLISLACIFLVVTGVGQLITVLTTYVSGDVAWRTTNDLRSRVAHHCLNLDMNFHHRHTPGEFIERIDGDITNLSNFFSQFVVQVIGSLLLLLGILVLLARENALIGLVFSGYVVLAAATLMLVRNIGVDASKAERQASAELFGTIEEQLDGLEELQSNGGTSYALSMYFSRMRTLFQTGRKAWMLRTTSFGVTNTLYLCGTILVLVLGLRLYLSHQVTLGTLFLFYQYVQMLGMPIDQLTNQIQDLQRAKSSLARLDDLLKAEPSIVDGKGVISQEGPPSLEFANVTFGYSNDCPILHDITFRLAPGRRLGIVGRTGSGKTSISRLILRLYDVNRGAVRVGGADVRDYKLEELYQEVGIVTQNVQLFQASVRDNLTLFHESVGDEEILRALQRLGLLAWFEGLPEGLDTWLDSNNGGLSAGEAQLLALARVFLTKPCMVILDEPSSRLDPVTEAKLDSAVEELLSGRTTIMIAHRLATLERCDDILVLDAGRVVEYGSRVNLASNPSSRFHALLQAEMKGVYA